MSLRMGVERVVCCGELHMTASRDEKTDIGFRCR